MTVYRVSAPVTTYTGDVGDLHFDKGVYEGPVEDAALAYFEGAGYKVETLAEAKRADADAAKVAADNVGKGDNVGKAQADADLVRAEAEADAAEAADKAAKAEAAKAAKAEAATTNTKTIGASQ